MVTNDERQASLAEGIGRRGVLLRALAAAGLLAACGGLPRLLTAPRVRAAEVSRETEYKATAFKEGRRLVAVVLDPVHDGYDPLIFSEDGITAEKLGNGTLDAFESLLKGMNQSGLADNGTLGAVVYSLRTSRGDYARIVSLGGNRHVVIANPGQSDFGGGGGGGY